MRVIAIACAVFAVTACSEESTQQQAVEPPPAPVSAADEQACTAAKEAAVAARTEYDRDYERRNPGAVSASLSVDELTSCKLTDDGAFVGKWGGQRWRFVPKSGERYSRNPRQIWVGQDEGLDGLSWFSEWRSDGASVEKNQELNDALTGARNIYG